MRSELSSDILRNKTMVTKTKITKTQIQAAWEEASPIKGKNPKIWRRDENGTIIKFSEFNKDSKFAWEIK